MIKRRFYRADHGDKDGGSSESSSSSDSDIEAQSADDSDTQPQPEPDSDVEADQSDDHDHDHDKRPSLKPQSPSSSSSGYESEDSSANEIEAESGGLLANDDDGETGGENERLDDSIFLRKKNGTIEETLATDHPIADVVPSFVLKCKSVLKCRLCPKIVCLNEESLNTHLKSKRHTRSEKLLSNGRLKHILNSDGEEEILSDDGETHAERHARIVALAQNTDKKKSRGRQRQRKRLKRKNQNPSSNIQNDGQQKDNRAKRRRKNMD